MDAPAFVHHAVPVHPDQRERLFKETLSFHAAEKVLQRRFNRAGWIAGSVGALLGLAGVAAVVVLLPLKQTTVKWIEVDSATGWVGEVAGAVDAPRLFGERVAGHFLRQYVEAREGYVPETDQLQWDTVRAMSSAASDCPSVWNTSRWFFVSMKPAPRTPVARRAALSTSFRPRLY